MYIVVCVSVSVLTINGSADVSDLPSYASV